MTQNIMILIITIIILLIGYLIIQSIHKKEHFINFENIKKKEHFINLGNKKKKVRFSNIDVIYNIENKKNYSYINDNKKCCLIEKKYVPDPSSIYNGNFKYIYNKLSNDECSYDLYNLDNNKQLMMGWDKCSSPWEGSSPGTPKEVSENATNKIGSCRNMNFECIDFVDKTFCDNNRMDWSELTCNNSLPYSLNNPKLPINKETRPLHGNNDGSYNLF